MTLYFGESLGNLCYARDIDPPLLENEAREQNRARDEASRARNAEKKKETAAKAKKRDDLTIRRRRQ